MLSKYTVLGNSEQSVTDANFILRAMEENIVID